VSTLEFEDSNQPILKEIHEEEARIHFKEEQPDNSREIKDRKMELLYGQNVDFSNIVIISPKYYRHRTRYIQENSNFFRYVQTINTPNFRFWPFNSIEEFDVGISSPNHIFDSIETNFDKIYSNFDDLRLRQICYNDVKDQIDELWDIRPLDDNYNELLVLIIQFIKNNFPENLDKEQVNSIKDSLNKLRTKEINERDIEKIFDDLIDSGMIFFPSIEGLSELYED